VGVRDPAAHLECVELAARNGSQIFYRQAAKLRTAADSHHLLTSRGKASFAVERGAACARIVERPHGKSMKCRTTPVRTRRYNVSRAEYR